MASIPYFQGAQAEIELRVRIGILKAELKLANDHKQAADLVIVEFAKIFTQNNAQSYRNRSTAEDVAILKEKLSTANTEVLTLKAQLSQSNALLYSLLPHLNKSVASSVTEPPSPKITPAVTTTTVKVKTEDLTTLRDDESDDGMESPSDPKEHHSSLSSSFSNNSDGYKHIARFVKSRKEEKQREETKPKEEIPGNIDLPSKNAVAAPKTWDPMPFNLTGENATPEQLSLERQLETKMQEMIQRGPSPSPINDDQQVSEFLSSLKDAEPFWKTATYVSRNPSCGFGARRQERGIPSHASRLSRHRAVNPFEAESLFYKPLFETHKAQRTVLFSNLALCVNEQMLLESVRGGIVVQAQLLKTTAITKTPANSALVEFYTHDAAADYTNFRSNHPLTIDGQQASIRLIPTATFPMPQHVRNAVQLWGYSRCFELHNLLEIKVSPAAVRRDISIGSDIDWAGLEVIRAHFYKGSKVLELRFVAIKYAVSASTVITTSEKYKGSHLKWLPDPCARPLKTALEPEIPKLPPMAMPNKPSNSLDPFALLSDSPAWGSSESSDDIWVDDKEENDGNKDDRVNSVTSDEKIAV